MGRRSLVHIVHGSKTGLVLPELPEIDALLAEHGDDVSLVVDACQARITSEALHAYLDHGAIVFLTGSKFMGGPPFSGFALVPAQAAERAERLPAGLANVFRRAEWPEDWPGREQLPDEDNRGLWLRLDASIFELERFQMLPLDRIERMVATFSRRWRGSWSSRSACIRSSPMRPATKARRAPTRSRCARWRRSTSAACPRRTRSTTRCGSISRWHWRASGSASRCAVCARPRAAGQARSGSGPAMPQFVAWAQLSEATMAAELDRAMADIADALVSHRCEEAA
jgi:hypothetical protein